MSEKIQKDVHPKTLQQLSWESGKTQVSLQTVYDYCIGKAEPVGVVMDTFGTGKVSEQKLVNIVRKHFDLTPRGIIHELKLLRPIYQKTAAYGHFGRKGFTWEKTDKAELLKKSV